MCDEATLKKLRNQNASPVSVEQAYQLVEDLKLDGYVECSALTQSGINIVFTDAANLAVGKPSSSSMGTTPKRLKYSQDHSHRHSHKKCVIL